jgi:hypothetical protein
MAESLATVRPKKESRPLGSPCAKIIYWGSSASPTNGCPWSPAVSSPRATSEQRDQQTVIILAVCHLKSAFPQPPLKV